MRVSKSRRQHHANRSHRASVEPLDPRQLLSAAAVDPATELLRQRIWDAAGVSAADANGILAARHVHADAAAGVELSDVAYLSPLSRTTANALSPTIQAVQFELFSIDQRELSDALRTAPQEGVGATVLRELPTLMLPTPDGGVARFGMSFNDLLTPSTAAQHPEIQSVRLFGLDDATAYGHATVTSSGLTAFVSSTDGDWSIRPVDFNQSQRNAYASYFEAHQAVPSDIAAQLADFCKVDELHAQGHELHRATEGNDNLIELGPTRKTFRLAMAGTGEFTAQFANQTAAFNYLVGVLATGNTIFNRDFNLQLQLMSNTSTIFTNAATDGYTNGASNLTILNDENTAIMNSVYGSATFDLGIVLAAGGVAGLASGFAVDVGDIYKAATSMRGTSNTLVFQRGIYHELAHKMGAGHTFNTAGVPDATAAYEPGPGSTIMAYAGLGFPGNFASVDDPYFHHRSIDQVEDGLRDTPAAAAAAVETQTGNVRPQVNAGLDRSIPANTPFELTGQAYDTQGGALTYTWEQYDLGTGQAIGTDDGTNPLFRSRDGTESPTRMFPELDDLLANRVDADEFLPTMARSTNPLTFRLTVKDQLGGVSDDVIDLPVVNTGSGFAITSQNSAGTTWTAGSSQTVTWNVAGTTGNGINTSNVDIFISYDAGVTFTPVALSFPNNGSGTFNVPVHAPGTTTARVKVKGRDNYFFDINNANITINGTAALNGLPVTAPAVEASIYAGPKADIVDADFPKLGGLNPNLESVGDTDTYLFGPDATGLYTIDAGDDDSGAPSSVDTVLAVYDHFTGAQIAINDDISGANVDSKIFAFLEAGKLYRIAVGDFGSNDAGEVSLTITGGPVLPTTPISLNDDGDGAINGNLVSGRTAKFHTFTVPTLFAGAGTINFSAPNSTLVATIYDSSDVLQAYSINGTFSGSQISGLVADATYTLRIGAKDYAIGGGDYNVNINLTTVATPLTPDLFALDDLGPNDSDNVTNVNTELSFLFNTTTNIYYRLFRDGVQVAGPTQPTFPSFMFLHDPGVIPDGNHTYTVTAAFSPTSAQTPVSNSINVRIDTAAPASDGFSFVFDDGAQDQKFFVDYAEGLFGLETSDIVVRNLTTNQVLPSSNFNLFVGPTGFNDLVYNPTAGNDRVPSGNYEISINAGAATDLAGNPIAARLESFFFLDADANRDRAVNINDFAILASRFNQPGTFSQGDFDYNGVANISDFALLASRFNTSLPAPANLPRQSGESLRPERSVFSQIVVDEDESLADVVG